MATDALARPRELHDDPVPGLSDPGTPPPPDDAVHDGDPGDGDDAGDDAGDAVPWWHSPRHLLALGAALVFLGVGIGAVLATPSTPGPGSVDASFLQEMRFHHDQAVAMSMIALAKPRETSEPRVRLIAQEVVLGQQLETGLMVQLLRSWGLPETAGDTAMAWMGGAVPIERMPGLANRQQLQALREASGAQADRLYLTMLVAHHEGGVHMAKAAAQRASTREVRELAGAMVSAQTAELGEVRRLLAELPA